MQSIVLEGRGDFAEWRDAARRLLLDGVPPDAVEWFEKQSIANELFTPQAPPATRSNDVATAETLTVSRAFLALAQTSICHSNPGRFALLYRILFRLRAERDLLSIGTDDDVAQLHALEKSVRRDSHKMTAFVRFKEVYTPNENRRRFFAWFEPDHHIMALTAPFFQRRFMDMDWVIASPRGSASWDGTHMSISTDPASNPGIKDDTDELWRTYFSSIFNPARLKVKMMQSEMPKKYWKNLPEAALIPGLIATAEARVRAMAEREASNPPAFHQRLQARLEIAPERPPHEADTLQGVAEQARSCTRCALHCKATQTVFGEGPADARIMVVGEQPGDREDLAGRPFVGPAGKLFDSIAHETGFDRAAAYVTNAVKHFKYQPRGKQRIHQRPNMSEVEHCRWWLSLEIQLVKPKLIILLGATALASLTGGKVRFADMRGQLWEHVPGQFILVTVHPSYLLRIPDPRLREQEMATFRRDIARASAFQTAQ